MEEYIDNVLIPRIAVSRPMQSLREFYIHFENPHTCLALLKLEVFLKRSRDEANARLELAWYFDLAARIDLEEAAQNENAVGYMGVVVNLQTVSETQPTMNRQTKQTAETTGTTRHRAAAGNTEAWWLNDDYTSASPRSSQHSCPISRISTRSVYSPSIKASEATTSMEVWWLTNSYTGSSSRSPRSTSPLSATSSKAVWSPSVENSEERQDRFVAENSRLLTTRNNLLTSQNCSPCMEARDSREQDHVLVEDSKDVPKPQNWKSRARAWLSRAVKQKVVRTASRVFRSHLNRERV